MVAKKPVLTLHGDFLKRSGQVLRQRRGGSNSCDSLGEFLTQLWREALEKAGGRLHESVTLFTDGSFEVNYSDTAPASEPAANGIGALEAIARFFDGRGPRPPLAEATPRAIGEPFHRTHSVAG